MIVARSVLAKQGSGYSGELNLFGFRYGIVVTRCGDGIEVTAYDGPPIGLYRIPTIDDANSQPRGESNGRVNESSGGSKSERGGAQGF